MSDLRTALEKEAQHAIEEALHLLLAKVTGVEPYMEVMGLLRSTIKHLENKRYGCASGRHSMPCGCKP